MLIFLSHLFWNLTKNFRLAFFALVANVKVQSIVDVRQLLFFILLNHIKVFGAVVVKQIEIKLINF